MRLWAVAAVVVCLSMTPVAAQDWLSNVPVAVNVGAQLVHGWGHRDSLRCMAINNALSFGASELLKRLVHEQRPDRSDRLSFPSGHAAMAAVNSGWNVSIGIPLTFGTAVGRVRARKHWWWDTLAGGALGFSMQRWGCQAP